jgi:phosphosulfolactate synthase (CoM biosynthesis protein A)
LEDVKGNTVVIDINTSPSEFDEFVSEAEKVLDTVKWGGS